MKKANIVLSTLLITITIFFITFYAWPRKKDPGDAAFCYLQEGNFTSAAEALSALPQGRAILYYGYLAELEGNFEKASLLFSKAEQTCCDHLAEELLFAKTVNSYFRGNEEEFDTFVEELSKKYPAHPWIAFFDGLVSYSNDDYKSAIALWDGFNFGTGSEEKRWQYYVMNRLFSSSFLQVHLAHALLMENAISRSREILEHESLDNDLAKFFLGLSYLKETENVPYEKRESYYKLALFYFNQANTLLGFSREKRAAIQFVVEKCKSLLEQEIKEQKYALNFICVMQKWGASQELEPLASKCVILCKDLAFCDAVRESLNDTPFYNRLMEKLLQRFVLFLKEKKSEALFENWQIIEKISSNPVVYREKIASWTLQELISAIAYDNHLLQKTIPLLSFLDHIGYKISTLSKELLARGMVVWGEAGSEKKAIHLMDLALEISQNKDDVRKEMEQFLLDLYLQAEKSNMVERLSLIYDALVHFKIKTHTILQPTTLANHLADAEYRFETQSFASARSLSRWILKVEPNNERALRIFGLSSYHLGDYAQAIFALSKLSNHDVYSHKALILSQILTPDSRGQLVQIDQLDSFEEDR